MANWRFQIQLNKVLADQEEKHDFSRVEEPCPQECLEELAVEVSKAWPLARFAGQLRKAKSIAEVNRILENVYNAADTHRVWCGLGY